MIDTSSFNTGGVGSISGQGAKIPHALWPRYKYRKQKQYSNKFDKDFKRMVHIRKIFKRFIFFP